MFLSEDPGDGFIEDLEIPGPDKLVSLSWVALPTPSVPAFLDLVVSIPEDNTGMISEISDVILNFSGDILDILVISWVHITGEHEIVPEHDTIFITEVVEYLVFELTTSPETEHVVFGIDCSAEALEVDLLIMVGLREVALGWDPVGTLDENGESVQDQGELLSSGMWVNLSSPACLTDTGSGLDRVSE